MRAACFAQSRALWLLKAHLAVAPGASYWWERYCAAEPDPDHLYLLSGIYQQLEKEGYQGSTMAQLQRTYLAVWTRYLQQVRLAVQALTALVAGGLEPILLKGLAVSSLLGWSGHRAMDDFDVLVRPEELEAAAALLSAAGWNPQTPLPTPARRRVLHGMSWQRQGQSLDLHWFIMPENLDPSQDEEWRARAQPVGLQGQSFLALDSTDLLLHTLVHGCKAGSRHGWVPDSCGLIREATIDWKRLPELARQRRVVMQCRASLAFLAEQLQATVPPLVPSELARFPDGILDRLYFQVKTRPRRLWWLLLWPLLDYARLPASARTDGFWAYLGRRWGREDGLWVEALRRLRSFWSND